MRACGKTKQLHVQGCALVIVLAVGHLGGRGGGKGRQVEVGCGAGELGRGPCLARRAPSPEPFPPTADMPFAVQPAGCANAAPAVAAATFLAIAAVAAVTASLLLPLTQPLLPLLLLLLPQQLLPLSPAVHAYYIVYAASNTQHQLLACPPRLMAPQPPLTSMFHVLRISLQRCRSFVPAKKMSSPTARRLAACAAHGVSQCTSMACVALKGGGCTCWLLHAERGWSYDQHMQGTAGADNCLSRC